MKFLLRMFTIIFILLLVWQMIVTIGQLPSYILPTPIEVLRAFHKHIALIAYHALPTVLETLLGLALGVIVGGIAGFLIAFWRPLSLWLLPLLIISQAIPTFAIAPLFVIWFGYGLASKIATTILMLFFPITSAFYDGLQRTAPGLLDLAKTMNATAWRLFWTIRIPSALPSFASGLRIAAVIAPIGAILGEWVGASRGLGYLMLNANARMQIDLMFAALLVIIIFSLTLYLSVTLLLRKFIFWQGENI